MPRQTTTSKTQDRTAIRLAWVIWASSLLLHVAGTMLAFLARSYPDGAGVLSVFDRGLLFLTQVAAYATIGALIAARQPRNPIGWLFLVSGLLGAFGLFAEGYWRDALFVRPGSLPAGQLMLWINTRPYSIDAIFSTLLILLFPTGRPPSRRWWIVGWLIIVGTLFNQVAEAFLPGPLDPTVTIMNPFGVASAAGFLQFGADLGTYILLLGMLGTVISLIVRFRRAQGVERQQIKLLAYALAINATMIGLLEYFLTSSGELSPIVNLIFVLQALASAFVAVAAGVAILRYRLWDIDIIIRRTLVYSTLSLTLGLLYIGCIVVLQQLVVPVTGGSELAIVASTLLIAALFNPLRRRIQALIDRRFFRRKYDAAKVLAAFGATARDETDLAQLTAEMLRVVDETVQPELVSLWLRSEPTSPRDPAP